MSGSRRLLSAANKKSNILAEAHEYWLSVETTFIDGDIVVLAQKNEGNKLPLKEPTTNGNVPGVVDKYHSIISNATQNESLVVTQSDPILAPWNDISPRQEWTFVIVAEWGDTGLPTQIMCATRAGSGSGFVLFHDRSSFLAAHDPNVSQPNTLTLGTKDSLVNTIAIGHDGGELRNSEWAQLNDNRVYETSTASALGYQTGHDKLVIGNNAQFSTGISCPYKFIGCAWFSKKLSQTEVLLVGEEIKNLCNWQDARFNGWVLLEDFSDISGYTNNTSYDQVPGGGIKKNNTGHHGGLVDYTKSPINISQATNKRIKLRGRISNPMDIGLNGPGLVTSGGAPFTNGIWVLADGRSGIQVRKPATSLYPLLYIPYTNWVHNFYWIEMTLDTVSIGAARGSVNVDFIRVDLYLDNNGAMGDWLTGFGSQIPDVNLPAELWPAGYAYTVLTQLYNVWFKDET
jgi:hypothetical protein